MNPEINVRACCHETYGIKLRGLGTMGRLAVTKGVPAVTNGCEMG